MRGAMSQENVAIVRRIYEAFYGGDAAGALAYFDPEVVIDVSRRLEGGIGHGRDELNKMIGEWVGTFDEWREEIAEMRDCGTQVYVLAVQHGRGKGSGVEVEERYALVYEVKGDMIARMTMYSEPAEALEAVGLSD
jgi:ketosteroid isomerase-like protein